VKDELARPPVIGKDPFTFGTAYPQALLTEKKCAVLKVLVPENFSL
jgi:hypothetical protein